MRRLTLAISAVLVTAAVASFGLLLAGSEARTQTRAAKSQYATENNTVPITTSQETSPEAISFGETSVSQGSLSGVDAPPEVIAAMDTPTDYSQVVDNASPERFKAPGWDTASSARYFYGENYSVEKPAGSTRPAQFKVEIPADDYYSVYAWWPAGAGNSTVRFGVSTASGIKWTKVNQQRDGGDWVKIGDSQMQAGDSYAVQISPDGGSGAVVADAVAVVRGAFAAPPYGKQAGGGEQLYSAARRGDGINGKDVVRLARKHIRTAYRRSPPHPCRAYRKEDCSCHTKVVFRRFDRRLRDNPVKQWNKGTRVSRSHLRKGDLVFFDEDRDGRLEPWDHVGIYSGNGNLVHASDYFDKVVESKMKYIKGYWGAKRLRPR
jgi:cell wall-associated NlpC family hydrolase